MVVRKVCPYLSQSTVDGSDKIGGSISANPLLETAIKTLNAISVLYKHLLSLHGSYNDPVFHCSLSGKSRVAKLRSPSTPPCRTINNMTISRLIVRIIKFHIPLFLSKSLASNLLELQAPVYALQATTRWFYCCLLY